MFAVAYVSDTTLQIKATIEMPPYPNHNIGDFCKDTTRSSLVVQIQTTERRTSCTASSFSC